MRKKWADICPRPEILGAGLVTLDIIIDNGAKKPIFKAGGTTCNVISGLSFLGWESTSVSRLGADFARRILVQDLVNNYVNVNYITEEEKLSTPRVIEKLDSNGEYAKHRFLFRCPSCKAYLPRFQSPRLDVIENVLKEYPKPYVYFFDRVTPSTLKLAERYREAGSLIVFEPINLKRIEVLEKAIRLSHIVKFAGAEMTDNVKMACGGAEEGIIARIDSCGPILIIQTLGKYGLLFKLFKDRKWYHQDSFIPTQLYDTCGAGDWCTVGLLFHLQELAKKNGIGLMESLKFKELINSALTFAQILASFSCMFPGARGLSESIDNHSLIKLIRASMKKYREKKIDLGKDWSNTHRKKVEINTEIQDSNACPTCLLPL